MNERIKKILELAESYNNIDNQSHSTDLENALKLEESFELNSLYQGISSKMIKEDTTQLIELLSKIDRSHGIKSRGKKVIIEAISFLESL